ncbi:MAG: TAT-variant-translocated molybdopterin oxidoreductase [Pirellulales bacterium]
MSRRTPLPEHLSQRLNSRTGRAFWQSLDELADAPDFRQYLAQEFPAGADQWGNGLDRRRFMSLMGAGLGLAGMTGCFYQPTETIVPYVKAPENLIPGKPQYYATTYCARGGAIGLLVESHMGRPTKIEGNELHPASLGATDLYAQASILQLYDPDRSQTIEHLAEIGTWDGMLSEVRGRLDSQQATRGAGVRILSERILSPTLIRQRQAFLAAFPEAKWIVFEPVGGETIAAGNQQAFGRQVNAVPKFEPADIVLSLDADFLSEGPASVRSSREFMARRSVRNDNRTMNRLYVLESTPTPTGAAADHRLPMSAAAIPAFAHELAERLNGAGAAAPTDTRSRWLDALAEDLLAHRARSLILVGESQPAEVHALAHSMNQALGNVGQTIVYTEPLDPGVGNQTESLAELTDDLAAGRVELLVILEANPVYTAPADVDFAVALRKAAEKRVNGLQAMTAVHLGLYRDETSELCHWHVPAAHYLESWSDARTFDGTASIVQPLIAPLYDGRTAHALLAAMSKTSSTSDYELVRETWRAALPNDFDKAWERWLHDGLIAGTALPPLSVPPRPLAEALNASPAAATPSGIVLQFMPDPTVWDGSYANNAWLQELPKPFIKLTWDNAALIAPSTAANLGLESGDLATLKLGDRTLEAAVFLNPGQPADTVSLSLGYGRRRAGRVGTGIGFNAYALRTTGASWFAGGLQITKTGQAYELAVTQQHHSLEGRDIVRWGDLEEYKQDPHSVAAAGHAQHGPLPTLFSETEWKHDGPAWGMSIDLTKCVGCNACAVACQAENNIATVGKEGVSRNREMAWLRIDSYYEGDPENPLLLEQPMLCQHCENAPCEVVCPVAATTHSPEGLNEMTYNRCIGTRYCSNNCPYKVRRFNFLKYVDDTTPVLKLLRNPDVTVRSRGVMEKCTFCVQRINSARIDAKVRAANEGGEEKIHDGEVVTACQAACSTQAIVFGDLNDANSRVRKLADEPQAYGVLSELGTRPRVSYLARVYNLNPKLAPAQPAAAPATH